MPSEWANDSTYRCTAPLSTSGKGAAGRGWLGLTTTPWAASAATFIWLAVGPALTGATVPAAAAAGAAVGPAGVIELLSPRKGARSLVCSDVHPVSRQTNASVMRLTPLIASIACSAKLQSCLLGINLYDKALALENLISNRLIHYFCDFFAVPDLAS